ncbi:BACON domain-containing protein, partial [Microbacterium caowuchunii]
MTVLAALVGSATVATPTAWAVDADTGVADTAAFTAAARAAWPEVDDVFPPGLAAAPSQLVFSADEGEACDTPQAVSLATWIVPGELSWTATTSASWLSLSELTGTTPTQTTATVACAELPVGVHAASIQFSAPGAPPWASDAASVPVQVVINPPSPVEVATWRDGHRGAFSVSTDDSQTAGFAELLANGMRGTFVAQGEEAPAEYHHLHEHGMEIGAHLVSHYCSEVSLDVLKAEIEGSIDAVVDVTGTIDKVSSLVWPCGFRTVEYGMIAADYFVSARGYYINELEDATPRDLMNLRSFNSHEHQPAPGDLKSIVERAENEGGWGNLVLHNYTNDDGAIHYAGTKDVWVAPIDDVVAYILQRDRTVLTLPVETAEGMTFDVSRLALPTARARDTEATLDAADTITLRVDVTGRPGVESASVGGTPVAYDVRRETGGTFLYLSTAVGGTPATVHVGFASGQKAALTASPTSLHINVTTDEPTAQRNVTLDRGGDPTAQWSATTDRAWLSAPHSGTAADMTVEIDASGLAVGSYSGSVRVTAPGHETRTIPVTLDVLAPGSHRYTFDYADRAALTGAGWSFIARTASGQNRNTERTSGAVVAYGRDGLRVPADSGDLWERGNDTRNTLFHTLPSGWRSAEARVDFAPYDNFQLAGIAIYGDDDNYVQLSRAFNSFRGGNGISLISETGGSASELPAESTNATSLTLRLTRDVAARRVDASVSTDDGMMWREVGSVNREIQGAKVALTVGGSVSAIGGYTVARIRDVTIRTASTPSPTPTPTPTPTPDPTPTPTPTPDPTPTPTP